MSSLKLQVIIGSTRPDRFSEKPAQWIFDIAKKLPDVDVEMLDLRDWPLPFYEEPHSLAYNPGKYTSEITKKWAEKVAEADGYIIVTPEYNHGTSGVLKNALDNAYVEWNNKAVGFVGYGSVGGARAIEQLRLSAIELQMAPVRSAVHIQWASLVEIKEGKTEAYEAYKGSADTMLKQLVMWSKALKSARETA